MSSESNQEMIVCIPGPWKSRSGFVVGLAEELDGEFIFAGKMLYHPDTSDYIDLEFEEMSVNLHEAFSYAGQGRISEKVLDQVEGHQGVVYLHFPFNYTNERERIANFTRAIQKCGGYAIKIESTGVAHEWDRWFELVKSDDIIDAYCACVVLVGGDSGSIYSYGMHHFGLPETEVVAKEIDVDEAIDTINEFNVYQLVDETDLDSGHTFSVNEDAAIFQVSKVEDERHEKQDLFHNPNGIWRLERT